MIWSLILAAGMSTRMGEQKLLLPFGDRSIVETVIARAAASLADRTLVVLGADRENIEKLIASSGVRSIHNPWYKKGMLSSVQCGVGELPGDARAVVLLLGDQPSVASETIDNLIGVYHTSKKGIILPVYNKRRGHPVLIDLKYRQEIMNLDPNIGLRQLIHRHPEDSQEVEVDSPAIHQDIDTHVDYRLEIHKLSSPVRLLSKGRRK